MGSGPDVAALEKQISELKAKKAAALESEDYDAANQFKGEIDSLTAQIEGCQTDNKAEEDPAAAKEAEEEPAAKKKPKSAKKLTAAEREAAKHKADEVRAISRQVVAERKKVKKANALEKQLPHLVAKKAAALKVKDPEAVKKIKAEIDAIKTEMNEIKGVTVATKTPTKGSEPQTDVTE